MTAHIRDVDKTTYEQERHRLGYICDIECRRCGYKFSYATPNARLVGVEIQNGFNGD